ncbi:MAG: hypothetical protein VB050_08325 [Geobacteraceae bacterium]|nr:hypothetical protein [Geobacteraceae bacterium]
MSETSNTLGMGWLPDYPDFRDYTPEHAAIQGMLAKAKVPTTLVSLPSAVDLRAWCSPVEN